MFNLALRGGGVCWLRLRFPVPAGMHRKGLEHVGQLTVPRTSRVMVYSARQPVGWALRVVEACRFHESSPGSVVAGYNIKTPPGVSFRETREDRARCCCAPGAVAAVSMVAMLKGLLLIHVNLFGFSIC
jgi:hypothetical protein